MKDNSVLVNSSEKESKANTYSFDHISIIEKESFEYLGFKFESIGSKLNINLPDGWILKDSEDGFTADFIDENGIIHAKIEFGNYPYRAGCMWLCED